MRPSLLFSMAALAALTFIGCKGTTSPVETGIVGPPLPEESLAVGDLAPRFGFNDVNGKYVRFNAVRGEVTILAIVGATEPETRGVVESLLDLANRYSNEDVDVRFACISVPAGGVGTPDSNVVQRYGLRSSRLIGLCDDSGEIRSLYKVKKPGVYFVIDEDGKIAGKGNLADLADLKNCVARVASKVASYNRFWKYDE
jgi:hypothetical protein